VYRRDLLILFNEGLENESVSHVLLVPFLVGILVYEKRDLVKASLAIRARETKYADAIIGACFCLIALLVYWFGSYTFYPLEYHLLTLPIFVMGVCLIIFNFKSMLALISPILFLFFLVPPPNKLVYEVGGILANLNTYISHYVLQFAGLPVSVSYTYGPPSLILTSSGGTPTFFTIDVPCSGIYSLIGFAIFSMFLVFLSSDTKVRRFSVILLGFLVFFILNIARVVIIISVAHFINQELAMTLFHLFTGIVLVFFGMIFTLFIAENIFNIDILSKREDIPSCLQCSAYMTPSQTFCLSCGTFLGTTKIKITNNLLLKASLLLVGLTLAVISINAPIFSVAAGPIDITTDLSWANTTKMFPRIPSYDIFYLYRDLDYEKRADQDFSLLYAYFPSPSMENRSNVFVAVGVADSISNLHSWEVCLISMPLARGQIPSVSVLEQKDVTLLPEIPLIARYLVFSNENKDTQITLYWYEKATFKSGYTISQKYVRISLIIILYDSTSFEQFEEELINIGTEVASFWEPIQNQSLISIGVPAQQLLLIVSVFFVAITKITQYVNDNMERTKNMTLFTRLATEEEKKILHSIRELSEIKREIETRDIKSAVEKVIKKNVSLGEINKILKSYENYGFIQRNMVFQNNKPRQIWKIY